MSYRPRLSIELTADQATSLRNLIPWGLKNQLFSIIIDDVIRLSTKLGPQFLAAILSRNVKLEEYTDLGGQEHDDNN